MIAQRAAALAYAAAGALVLPLHTPAGGGCSCRRRDCGDHIGKHPRTMRGLDDAANDISTVERWWSMWPAANIGVRPAVGIVVIDVDPRHGGGTSLLNLERKHGRLPRTQTAATGGGGLHIWLGHHGPARGSVGPGLDVKTHSGYVVMPPSAHTSGRTYSWVNEIDPIQPAPRWLAELLAPATIPLPTATTSVASPARAAALLRVVAEAQSGERNSRLFWACARAMECGLDVAPLIEAAIAVGLTEGEATRTVQSAARSVGAGAA
jgi:hypothetical protein